MIQQETIDERLVRHYSDAGYRIRQVETDTVYDEAVDVIPCRYTYEETDELIPEEEPEPMPGPFSPGDLEAIIAELRSQIDEQAEEIAALDEYIIELEYESIIDDLGDLDDWE